MTDYFYLDNNGTRRGPYNEERLQELAANGTIKPDTQIGTMDAGLTLTGLKKATELIPDSMFHSAARQKPLGVFDFGFNKFYTATLIKFIWKVIVVVAFLTWGSSIIIGLLAIVTGGDEGGAVLGVLYILLSMIALLIHLILVRIVLEFAFIVFCIIETHLRAIRKKDDMSPFHTGW